MPTEIETVFRGVAIPAEQIEKRTSRYDWEKILEAIEVGTGREVKISFGSCVKAVQELERTNKIKKGEYKVSAKKGPDGGRRVYIIHKAKK